MKPVNYNQVFVSQNLNFNLEQFWHFIVSCSVSLFKPRNVITNDTNQNESCKLQLSFWFQKISILIFKNSYLKSS